VKDIENFNKVVEILIKKNPVYKLLDPRKHLLKQYKDPLDFLTEDMEEKENRLHFFCERRKLLTFSSRILHWKKRIFKVSQTEGEKENLIGKFSSCNQKSEKKKEIISQLGAHIQKNGSAWKSTSEEN
jgi:hypothetical protein